MTIYLGSRYENSTVDFVDFSGQGYGAPIVYYRFNGIGRLTYNTYTWKEGDRLDKLSSDSYHYADDWWRIAEANPEIVDLQNIAPGTVLRIPRA
jgi:nucleoid-associated protein YgaU